MNERVRVKNTGKMKRETNKNKRHSKGITLVALVVTIVVLLILAGVTISTLFGDNGIISAARKAAEDTKTAENTVGDALNDLAEEMKNELKTPIKSAEAYLTDIRANLSTYRGKAQALGQTTDQNIGIGTDGEVANLDLWYYVKTDDGEGISLGNYDGCSGNLGYYPENIVDGRIQGKVPQYIYYTNEDKIYFVKAMTGTFNYRDSDVNKGKLIYAPEIPSSVTSMISTFGNCYNLLKAPKIPAGVTKMGNDYWLSGTFLGCTSLTTAPTIPSSVTSMDNTFSGCTGLTTAPTIPSSVTSMDNTFYGCTSLTIAPEIPSSVTNMGSTFYGCTGLTTAPEIPSSVTNMSDTFHGCTGLTTATTIPSSVTNMDNTFYGCTKLQGDLVISANPTYYYNCLYNAGKDATNKLYLTGSSTKLNQILATKGSSTNIEIK